MGEGGGEGVGGYKQCSTGIVSVSCPMRHLGDSCGWWCPDCAIQT